MKVTSLTYCQSSKLGRTGGKKPCLPSAKAATYPSSAQAKNKLQLHQSYQQVAIKVYNLTRATILTPSCSGLFPIPPPAHTHTQLVHVLVPLPSTGCTQPNNSFSSSLLVSYCSARGLFKNQSDGENVLSSMDFL